MTLSRCFRPVLGGPEGVSLIVLGLIVLLASKLILVLNLKALHCLATTR